MNFNYHACAQAYAFQPEDISQQQFLQNPNECNNFNRPLPLLGQPKLSNQSEIDYHSQWSSRHKHRFHNPQQPANQPFEKSGAISRDVAMQIGHLPTTDAAIYAANLNMHGPFLVAEHHPYKSRTTVTNAKKKNRTIFTSQQINELEKYFLNQQYITCQERDDLATKTKLTPNQVKIWFQNRRYKLKTKGCNQLISRSLPPYD